MSIITVNGVFDILHVGHIRLFKKAKEYGDTLIVLINSDESVKRLKGKNRPINSQFERMEVLESIKYVDKVGIFWEDTPLEILKRIEPRYHYKSENSIPERVEEERELLATWGGEIILLPIQANISTTQIIERIKNG